MDGTRHADIDHLTMVIHNPDESELHKRQAHRALKRIKQTMRDPFIKGQRERLIKAQRAADTAEVEKISASLQAYSTSKYGR